MINSGNQKLTGSEIHIQNQLKTVTAQLICPITRQIMQDPVVIQTGHVFQRSAIQAWFDKGKITNPLTNKPLNTLAYFPCIILKNVIKNLPAEVLAMKKQTKNLEQLLIAIEQMWNQTPREVSYIKKQKKKVDQENEDLKKQIKVKEDQNNLLKHKYQQLEFKVSQNIQLSKQKQGLRQRFEKVKNNLTLAQKQTQKLKNKINEHIRSNSQQRMRQYTQYIQKPKQSLKEKTPIKQQCLQKNIQLKTGGRFSTNKKKASPQNKSQFNSKKRQNSFGKISRYQNDKIKIVSKTNQTYSIYGQSVQQLVANQQIKYQSNKKQQKNTNFSNQNKKYQNYLSDFKQKNMFNQNKAIKQQKYEKTNPQNKAIDPKLNQGFYIPYTKERIITQKYTQKVSNNQKNLSYELKQMNRKKTKCLDSARKVDKTNPQKTNTEMQKKKQPWFVGVKNNYNLGSYNNGKPTKIQTKKS